ncbi:hypothetical protein ATN84_07470 [Paramesorhizobium deserti]|uniref:Lysozyme inhibitor LprI-like N-terminal domain-containing protein n=1 Tax=Paramesorhizobium deserti TaxID=1494590 RepID=A0A135HVM0_9HYPH|nr:pentapeptide repeat-containing protein [Paramesorhizobium deserti]KXF77236.1 hypothetical protein ATN84_07470 [Paramesorhizobium deserti]
MQRIFLVATSLLFMIGNGAVMPASAASFDCARASAPDEKAVCANGDLSSADANIAYNYETLLRLLKGDERQKAVDAQRAWLKARADCGGDISCLKALYDKQKNRLNAELTATQKHVAMELFRQTGQCFGCNFPGENFSGIKPAQTADNGLVNCTANAVVNGTFDGSRIDHANFVTCQTKYDSALASMSWNNASLRNVDFTGTNLGGNSMDYADLTGANLTDASLYEISMHGTILKGAKLVRVRSDPASMSGACSDFGQADFTDADLEKAEICGVFIGANFTGANLRNANITGYAVGVRPTDATEDAYGPPRPVPQDTPFGGKINLTGANLTGASIFTETTLKSGGYGFAILCRTTLPDGKISNRDCK